MWEEEKTEQSSAHWNENYDKDGDGVLFWDLLTLTQCGAVESPALHASLEFYWAFFSTFKTVNEHGR